MRPASNALRYAYRAAAAKLKAEGKTVTIRSLADEMEIPFKTAQRYVYRYAGIGKEIGVELEFVQHDVEEYRKVILDIPANVRPTIRRIAKGLGIDQSSVSKFLGAHPELRQLHARFWIPGKGWPRVKKQVAKVKVKVTKRRDAPKKPAVVVKTTKQADTPKTGVWSDKYVSVWSESASRFVGVNATREQYLDFWAKKLLRHQQESKPKPEHLPTPEEVALMH